MTKLQELRLSRNLSQSELAKLSGVNVRTLQDFDQGRKSLANAKGEMIYRLSHALCCSFDELVSDYISIDTYPDSESIKAQQTLRFKQYVSTMINVIPGYNTKQYPSPEIKRWISKAIISYEHAQFDYHKKHEDSVYLDSCCFHLQQSVEYLLSAVAELHGLNRATDHDIISNLNTLSNKNIIIPCVRKLSQKTDALYKWENDSFIAAVKDIEEVMAIAKELFSYVDSYITERTCEEKPFPDHKLSEV